MTTSAPALARALVPSIHAFKKNPMNHPMQTSQAVSPPSRTPVLKKLTAVLSVMSVVAGILTGIMTWANLGLTDAFVATWGRSFVIAMVVMMPLAAGLMALFDALARRLFPRLSALRKNVVIGLAMSVIMQSIMAVITAGNAAGFGDMTAFRAAWGTAFISAFPVGLVLALILTTVIKPRFEIILKS